MRINSLLCKLFIFCMCLTIWSFPADTSGGAIIVRRISDAYGVSSFSSIAKIRFTFNLVRDSVRVSRSWEWEPKTNCVTFFDSSDLKKKITYYRMDSPKKTPVENQNIDMKFINDQYWLLFPFHLVWDITTAISIEKQQPLPMGSGSATRVTICYPEAGGYTPGDCYELYVDDNYHIVQWQYRHGGSGKINVTAAWNNHQKAGPFLFSLDRPGPDGKFRVWFTDVAVFLDGSDTWIKPH